MLCLTRRCGTGKGLCQKGMQTCSDGSWGTCENNVEAEQETCDGNDNDCDGSVDEDLERSCGTSTGQCEKGTETCSNGSWGNCQGNVSPEQETCDGHDNDCDGDTDEGGASVVEHGRVVSRAALAPISPRVNAAAEAERRKVVSAIRRHVVATTG